MPEVVNVVAAGSLGRQLDISAVGDDIDAAEVNYNTDGYQTPTVYLREQEGGPLVTVYESGSYHISGATSITEVEGVYEWLVEALNRLGIEGIDPEFEVKNVVLVGDLNLKLDLTRLALELGLEQTEYEPEQFSGLVYRPTELPSVFLLFASGRVVVPGSPDEKTAFRAFDNLQEKLSEVTD
ncbi:TATA-box-binding protein [Natrinema salsiterrestre]|uniref:TATA-box-binding protein C n=1 Tax=Natrinema salsiterrestre TaxID=2950540 RepID=A0A9Q4Q1Q0_9EURY|nr:TATA-box-binding protein C [Natrinema salsiterrestre]MDF9748305.1 TATA-box-binding protein C [Natrinema salsiterrestre]